MAKPTIDDLQLVITRMITTEQSEHAALLGKIKGRNPPDVDKIVENLGVVSQIRIDVLEQILNTIKEMKAKK